jgi:cytochrome c biogenesis protein
MTTQQQAPEQPLPPLGSVGFLRWLWRQLTSMRTALILLFLLAVVSIPGSILPQRGTNPLRVDQWIEENPATAPILDALGFFDVYASPWFAAVYLLLFISLIGCVLPRVGVHLRALRTPPPRAPRNLNRLPASGSFVSELTVDQVLTSAAGQLRQGHWRVRSSEGEWVAAEKGYWRETGNLVFHLSLILVLVGIAVGGLLGWRGNVVVREGTGFSNTLTQYDAWGAGRFVSADALAPFSFTLEDFRVDFERGEAQRGAPREFEADLTYRAAPGGEEVSTTVQVNEPLIASGAKVFLVGHGYAPHVIVRDSTGRVVFDDTVTFLPQDGNFTSTGVIKAPDAEPALGFNGLFLPTAALTEELGPHSVFPAPDYPGLFLSAFTGDMGLDDGSPQSVYTLDTSGMEQIGLESLLPGDVWTLPEGQGSIEFVDLERWASFQIAHDPGKELALGASLAAMVGLMVSLFVRRRRIWVRAQPADDGGTLVHVGALARSEGTDVESDVVDLMSRLGAPDVSQERAPQ